jgi:hypothetical protein
VFESWTELFALLGSFVASALALVRFALVQHRSMLDRFMSFIVDAQTRQIETQDRFEGALDRLTENVRENSTLLTRIAERM